MNFRNRYLLIAVRILLGLTMFASGISGLLMGNSAKGVPPQMVTFTQVFWASGIFQMVKVTEDVYKRQTQISGQHKNSYTNP